MNKTKYGIYHVDKFGDATDHLEIDGGTLYVVLKDGTRKPSPDPINFCLRAIAEGTWCVREILATGPRKWWVNEYENSFGDLYSSHEEALAARGSKCLRTICLHEEPAGGAQ